MTDHAHHALHAKIAEMEQQEPVAFALYSGCARKAVYLSEIEACEQRDRRQLTADLGGSLEAYRVAPLYLAPGAQPAPSVPDTHNDTVMGLDYQGAMSCARKRAKQEAGLLYPEGDARKEEKELELASEYYRQYTTPNP